MPSSRRVKVLCITVAFVVLSILYLTSNARHSNQQFYDRTVAAMEATAKSKLRAEEEHSNPPIKVDADKDAAQVPLVPAAGPQDAPAAAIEKADGEVSSDAGRREPIPDVKKPPEGNGGAEKEKEKATDKVDGKPGIKAVGEKKWGEKGDKVEVVVKEEKSKEELDVDAELNAILKRSPIIIVSKTYCPFSKKAKAVFEKYSITPAPFIVELDKHELGKGLQDALGKTTKRKTVPNILIAGVSIGGGDEVVAMDEKGELMDKIKSLGGKRIMEIKKKS